MCFSAQASFTAAAVIGTIGVASIAKAKPHLRPLAVTPLFFAFQQIMEGTLWITLNAGDSTSSLHKLSLYLFLLVATVFWPLWIPSVLYKTEENPKRKLWLKLNIGVGCLVAILAGLVFLFRGYDASVVGHHIHYVLHKPFPSHPNYLFVSNILFILYLFPTLGSLFISTLRGAWLVGVVLAVGWIVSIVAFAMAFISVWCFFGAWCSIIIFFIVKK